MKELETAFRSLFDVNMGVRDGERIVVFSDTIRPDEEVSSTDRERREQLHTVAAKAAEFGQEYYRRCSFISFPATPASGAEPPELLWREVFGKTAIENLSATGILQRLIAKCATADDLDTARTIVVNHKDEATDIVVALANNSTSHTRFRALANATGTRFASLPHFDPEMFFTSMRVDWQALAIRTELLATAINHAETVVVTTPNGTSMRFDKRGRTGKGDTGILTAPGSFGNLPAGEVYLAPVEETSSGTMILEYAPTRIMDEPLTLTVRDGIVTDITGNDPYRAHLEQKFAESDKNRNIAELGIGTNDQANRPDNILEAEKILGTIHIALGDNSGFGGTVSTPFHEDFVFYGPTLTAIMPDGTEKVLIDSGKLLLG
jgi:leucyl aminopeptidase (aminopeptidase T)